MSATTTNPTARPAPRRAPPRAAKPAAKPSPKNAARNAAPVVPKGARKPGARPIPFLPAMLADALPPLPAMPALPALPSLDSVERVWLAGLGAVATTGDEGARLLDTLVKRGTQVDRRLRQRADSLMKTTRADLAERADGTRDLARDAARTLREAPADLAHRVSDAVESRLDAATRALLDRVGIPTRREMRALERRVEGLTAALATAPRKARRSVRADGVSASARRRPARPAPTDATPPATETTPA